MRKDDLLSFVFILFGLKYSSICYLLKLCFYLIIFLPGKRNLVTTRKSWEFFGVHLRPVCQNTVNLLGVCSCHAFEAVFSTKKKFGFVAT